MSEMIFYGGIATITISHMTISPNIMTELKGKGYQGITAIEIFEYENTRSDFVVITEKNEKQYVRLQLSIPGTKGVFPPALMVLLMNQ